MSTEVQIKHITLAVEHADMEAFAFAHAAELAPDLDITLVPLAEFADLLDAPYRPDVLPVIMLHATADGCIDQAAPIVQRILGSQIPVLVVRKREGIDEPAPELKRIVVPLDGSMVAGQAIPIASRVARFLKIPVRFVMVIDPSRVIPPAYTYDPDSWVMIEEFRHTAHWALSQAEMLLTNDGVDVTSDLLFGPINASLAASIVDGDLVIMTTHGTDRHGLRYRDSVALRTLASVCQPMLIRQAEKVSSVVIDAYQACSWAEPLHREPAGRF